MALLQGYYKTGDGQYYKAESNQSAASTSPGGSQLISYWTKLPKSISVTDTSLYIGPGVTGGALSEPGQEPSGYIHTAELGLNLTKPTVLGALNDVKFYPYTMTVLGATGTITENSETMNVVLNYRLARSDQYESGESGHKLVIRMTDPYGLSQERIVSPGTDLPAGMNSYPMTFNSPAYKNLGGGAFRITLLDEFQGGRIELANQAYNVKFERLPVVERPETPAPSPSPSATPSPSPSAEPSPTVAPTPSPSATPSPDASPAPSPTPDPAKEGE